MKDTITVYRRSHLPIFSVQNTCVILNTAFINKFYAKFRNIDLYLSYQKIEGTYYLLISKVELPGYVKLSYLYRSGDRYSSSVNKFSELRATDVPRYFCEKIKTRNKNIDIYKLSLYALDGINTLQC